MAVYPVIYRKIVDEDTPYFLAIIVSIFAYSSSEISPFWSISAANDMAARYRIMRLLKSSFMMRLLPPRQTIADPGAVFLLSKSIAAEALSAPLTGKLIICFFFHLGTVFLPPSHPASIRAIQFFLSPRKLINGLSTLPTMPRWIFGSSKRIPATKGFHSVDRQSQGGRNLFISIPSLLKRNNLGAFVIGHKPTPSRRPTMPSLLGHEIDVLSGCENKKIPTGPKPSGKIQD
jgi:hypothetical protein